jgi:ribosomal protein S4
MIYPGYQLNPGDMFQVEPDRVLYATGAPKTRLERREGRVKRREAKVTAAKSEKRPTDTSSTPSTSDSAPKPLADPKKRFQSLITQAETILKTEDVTAKRKQQLRAFKRLVRKTLSQAGRNAMASKSLDGQLQDLIAQLSISPPLPDPPSSESPEADSTSPSSTNSEKPISPAEALAIKEHEQRLLKQALEEARDNSIDPRKPYATPWRPREWMSAFAFVPRYLEVHHKVCSAVYLRHPVARPGLGEVPTPFPPEVNELTFNWYLRRR